jgi:hypothetical protein|tara:strand:- start:1338 stop:1508 length:171 start_codon:yes stop_codon:yes gene_type:complete
MIVECQAGIFKQFEDGCGDYVCPVGEGFKFMYEGEYLGLKAVKKVGHFNNLSQLDS